MGVVAENLEAGNIRVFESSHPEESGYRIVGSSRMSNRYHTRVGSRITNRGCYGGLSHLGEEAAFPIDEWWHFWHILYTECTYIYYLNG